MPDRPRKRPRDPNELASQIVEEATRDDAVQNLPSGEDADGSENERDSD